MVSGRVVGLDQLTAKRSAVAADGAPLEGMIDGVRFRPTRPVPHEDGTLAEVARMAWDEVSDPIVQVHVTTTLPGRVRAWSVPAIPGTHKRRRVSVGAKLGVQSCGGRT